MSRLRLIFFGSGAFGLPTLESLHAHHDVVTIVSQPDRPAGRKRKLTPTPVAAWAIEHDLPLIRADDINTDDHVQQLRDLQADMAIVIAFGQKLSPPIVEAGGKLMVNLHGSLLPKYRGAAPINWAVINGERETGVSVIGIAQRMDAGPVYAEARTPIDPTQTAGELHDRLATLGPDAMTKVIAEFIADALRPGEQDESQATRAPKLSRADANVDFTADAAAVANRINGLSPWPGVMVTWQRQDDGEMQLGLCRARPAPDHSHDAEPGTILPGNLIATGGGAVHLLDVQPPGKRVMTLRQFVNGHPVHPGERLSTSPS